MLIASGIAPLDARIGGIMPGRAYVLSGAPGTGKSLACLEFLEAALAAGETAAMLTHDDPADLLAQGEYLGLDLERALRDERLILLRFQLDFARRFGRAPSPDVAFEELRMLLGESVPRRIAIDSIAPFVDSGTAAGTGLQGLIAFLDACGATSLLTYPGDLAGRYDRRLEPLVQRAGAVLHLATEQDRTRVLEIRKVRYAVTSTAPVPFVIRPGVGLAVLDADAPRRRSDDDGGATRRTPVAGMAAIADAAAGRAPLLVLGASEAIAPALVSALHGRFAVEVRLPEAADARALAGTAAAVLVATRRDSVESTLALVRTLRKDGVDAPIALVANSSLRAVDRTRALRAGADEFLGTDLEAEELQLRIDRLVRQGRTLSHPSVDDAPSLPAGAEMGSVLDAHAFRDAIQARLTTSGVQFFTLLRLRPVGGSDAASIGTLAQATRAQVRVESGDLMGHLDGGVGVYLHSARRKDAPVFLGRLRDVWRAAGGGDLDVTTIAYPAEESALRDALGGMRS